MSRWATRGALARAALQVGSKIPHVAVVLAGAAATKTAIENKKWSNFVTSHGAFDAKGGQLPISELEAYQIAKGKEGLKKKPGTPVKKNPKVGVSDGGKVKGRTPVRKRQRGATHTNVNPLYQGALGGRTYGPGKKTISAGTPTNVKMPQAQEKKGFQWNTGTTALAAGLGGALVGSYLAGRKKTNITINNTPVMKNKYYYR